MPDIENRILIITGGKIEESFLQDRVKKQQYSVIIAVDHGLTAADRCKLKLDFIVGDFDSVPDNLLKKYQEGSIPIKIYPVEKDKTDTELAIELALRLEPTGIDIIGATGTRLDHVLANIHLLLLPMQLGVITCLLDPNNRIHLAKESFEIKKETQYGNYVSLIPFTEKIRELSLSGFKYPLNKVTMTAGNSLGISNEIIDEIARVEFMSGILVVIEARD